MTTFYVATLARYVLVDADDRGRCLVRGRNPADHRIRESMRNSGRTRWMSPATRGNWWLSRTENRPPQTRGTTMKTYDAGDERETLARELADWKAAGFMESGRARRWHRRTRRLAKACGMTRDFVISTLNADAEYILSEAH